MKEFDGTNWSRGSGPFAPANLPLDPPDRPLSTVLIPLQSFVISVYVFEKVQLIFKNVTGNSFSWGLLLPFIPHLTSMRLVIWNM